MALSQAKQVAACNRRARDRGLVGTLSTLDWQRTLEFFHYRCAYCNAMALTIDHFMPMMYGGGTTHSNCVPCCHSCNERKGSLTPEQLVPSLTTAENFTRIRTYLEEIGARNQFYLKRLCEREKRFARMNDAVLRLKHHCDERMRVLDEQNPCYVILRYMLFGVEWDPAYYYQVLSSLLWHREHSTVPVMRNVCETALQVLQIEFGIISQRS